MESKSQSQQERSNGIDSFSILPRGVFLYVMEFVLPTQYTITDLDDYLFTLHSVVEIWPDLMDHAEIHNVYAFVCSEWKLSTDKTDVVC